MEVLQDSSRLYEWSRTHVHRTAFKQGMQRQKIPKAWLRANRMVLGVDSSMSISRMMLECWLMAFVDLGTDR